MIPQPPPGVERLLLRAMPPGAIGSSIVGDLREEHAGITQRDGRAKADRWYRREAAGLAARALLDRARGHGPFTTTPRTVRGQPRRMETMISQAGRSLRHALRGLSRTPQFTLAAVVTLALAIGTNTAVFSVVHGVLLSPLPYAGSDRLVTLRHTAPGLGYDDFGTSPGLFLLYAGESGILASSGLFTDATVNLTGDDAPPSRIAAVRATHDLFTTLAAAPALGRTFDEAEQQPDAPDVVLLSHGLWQERFGGDPAVIGREVQIDGAPHTVVGVMPARFEFPSPQTRLWLPLRLQDAETMYGAFSFQGLARLGSGIDAAQAEARLQPLLGRLRDDPVEGSDFAAFMEAGRLGVRVKPLKEQVVGDVGPALWILLGTVAFVFLIACANVTNLFLVRAEARQKEMAVRAALGGGRGSLIGHYAAESVLLALGGGLLGLLLSVAMLHALLNLAPPNIPRLHEVGMDPMVLLFTIGVTTLAALLLGVLPTLKLTSPDLLATLSRSTRGGSAGRERNRTRQVLVVAQTALALMLLVGSGLMVRSFQQLRAVEPGFDPENVLTFRVSLPSSTYDEDARVAQFHSELLERLRALPGVQQVGATSHPPLDGCCSGTAHFVEDHPVEPGRMPPMFWYSTVTDGWFEAMRIPIVAGRAFDARDRDPETRGIIVSRELAEYFWPGGDPLGRRIRTSAGEDPPWYVIVGVAGSVRDRGLTEDPGHMVYYPVAADMSDQPQSMTYAIRTQRGDAIAPLARSAVWDIDPNLPVAASATYSQIVANSMVRVSFTMLALVAASFIALVLGAIGLYSVISYLVTQRTNEIGIRLALGARPAEVRRMVVLQGARLAAIGLAMGMAGAFGLTRLMQGMLYGTEPNDPLTFAVVSAFLAGIALLATWLPASRAARIDPASSLRAE